MLQDDPIVQSDNSILSELPDDDWKQWKRQLKPVWLNLNETVQEAGHPMKKLFLPVSSIFSVSYFFADGSTVEFAEIGNEGISGSSAFSGHTCTIWNCSVITAGLAYQADIDFVLEQFSQSQAVRDVLLRYMQFLMLSTAQTAMCNRRHSITQQLAKILLLNHDRVLNNDLTFTHELLGRIMGVRREGVTQAAGHLQSLGAIEYRRGIIRIQDRDVLSSASCECYETVMSEKHRIKHPTALKS
jgi:CRP-like cAMP-binding protein